jgi:hypothetical protein
MTTMNKKPPLPATRAFATDMADQEGRTGRKKESIHRPFCDYDKATG